MNIVYIVAQNFHVDKVFSDLETAQHYLSAKELMSDEPSCWSLTAYPIERRQITRSPW